MSTADKATATILIIVVSLIFACLLWLAGEDSMRQEAVEIGYAHYDPQDRSFVWGPAYVACPQGATCSNDGSLIWNWSGLVKGNPASVLSDQNPNLHNKSTCVCSESIGPDETITTEVKP